MNGIENTYVINMDWFSWSVKKKKETIRCVASFSYTLIPVEKIFQKTWLLIASVHQHVKTRAKKKTSPRYI